MVCISSISPKDIIRNIISSYYQFRIFKYCRYDDGELSSEAATCVILIQRVNPYTSLYSDDCQALAGRGNNVHMTGL